jgi:hypothetical protein
LEVIVLAPLIAFDEVHGPPPAWRLARTALIMRTLRRGVKSLCPAVTDLNFWHERMSDSTSMSFCRIASHYCGLRIADFLLPKALAEAIRNPQSAMNSRW